MEEGLGGDQPVGVRELVLSSFVRIVTNHRVYREPAGPEAVIEFCDVVPAAAAAVPIRPGPSHRSIFAGVCHQLPARGNSVPDACLAALASEHGVTWVRLDAGFARFPGLSLQEPLAG